jgi:hypothetical protein
VHAQIDPAAVRVADAQLDPRVVRVAGLGAALTQREDDRVLELGRQLEVVAGRLATHDREYPLSGGDTVEASVQRLIGGSPPGQGG